MTNLSAFQITDHGYAASDAEKAAVSHSVGRNRYVVFARDGKIQSTSIALLAHALDAAHQCGGELWLGGRCVVPAHNV